MTSKKILIVDDISDNIQALYQALKDNYELYGTTKSEEAVPMARQLRPDLILLDVMMPVKDGYAVCDELKRGNETTSIPVIFITAKTDSQSENMAFASGAVDFIHKPFSIETVRARVKLHLKLADQQDSLTDLNRQLTASLDRLRVALEKSERLEKARSDELKTLIEALPSPVLLSYDKSCAEVIGNGAALTLFGLNDRQAETHRFNFANLDEEPYQIWRQGRRLSPLHLPLHQVMAGGQPILGDELRIVRADGGSSWICVNTVPLFAEDGAIRGCICVGMDITPLKLTETALRASNAMARTLLNIPNASLVLVDRTGICLDASDTFAAKFQHDGKELLGRPVWEVLPPRLHQMGKNFLARLSSDKRLIRTEVEWNGLWDEYIFNPIVDDNGNVVKIAVMTFDITDRIHAEKLLKEKSDNLYEVNSALKALLRQLDEDRKDFENTILGNVKHLIFPYLDSLKKSQLSSNQAAWVDTLYNNLNQITSTFTKKFTLPELQLSTAELRVASLVRDGKSTKEIAEILILSEKTVAAHRDSIRAKLNLRGKKGGLRSLLINLS